MVQPLGGAAGALRLPPYVRLDVDRGGAGGAELSVNLDHAVRFRRVLVYLALRGAGRSFADVRGTVTVRPDHGPPQDFALGPGGPDSTACALLLLTPEGTRCGCGGRSAISPSGGGESTADCRLRVWLGSGVDPGRGLSCCPSGGGRVLRSPAYPLARG